MRGIKVAVAIGAFALMPVGAHADKPAEGAAADRGTPAVALVPLAADAIKRIKSDDPAQIKSGLDDARISGRAGAAAVPAIAQRLRDGLSPILTQAAIETLGDIQSEAGTDVLSWYARHRNVGFRRSAVEALAKTRGPNATLALRASLSDADPAVRGLAATALGEMKVREAVPDLFAALERSVPEAAAAIGELCSDNDCERLASKIGSMPFDVVTSGLDEVLMRPQTDVKDDLKVKIVGRVREMGTAEANRFLKGVQTRWPTRASQRVKQAIDQAVLATASSPGGEDAASAP